MQAVEEIIERSFEIGEPVELDDDMDGMDAVRVRNPGEPRDNLSVCHSSRPPWAWCRMQGVV